MAAAEMEREPACLGLNFGNTYTSVAVYNPSTGLADCIANEDGERQIASVLSVARVGGQELVGNQAKAQIVRNARNTIVDFKNNFLERELPQKRSAWTAVISAELQNGNYSIETIADEDGNAKSAQTRTLTPRDAALKYLRAIKASTFGYLGRDPTSTVLAVPVELITDNRKAVEDLQNLANEAGFAVKQVIAEPSAVMLAYDSRQNVKAQREAMAQKSAQASHSILDTSLEPNGAYDRRTLVLDIGGTTTTATVIAVRSGIYSILGHISDQTGDTGSNAADNLLSEHFAKEFKKKTKVDVGSDSRGQAKLLLASEQTKRSLSNAATAPCSIESLCEGLDFTTQINRTRFDLLLKGWYSQLQDLVASALKRANTTAEYIDEVLLAGGAGYQPGITSRLADLFPEGVTSIFCDDPDEAIAKGCALQANLIDEVEAEEIAQSLQEKVRMATSVTHDIGVVIPALGEEAPFIAIIPAFTSVPAKKTITLDVEHVQSKDGKLSIEIWEAVNDVKNVSSNHSPAVNGEEDSEEEEEEKKSRHLRPTNKIADVSIPMQAGSKQVNGVANKSLRNHGLDVTLRLDADGSLKLVAWQRGTPMTTATQLDLVA